MRGRSLLLKLRKALFEAKGVVVPAWRSEFGESSEIDFSTYVEAYLTDPAVKAVVDNLTAQIVGTGFYIVTDPPELKASLEQWNEDANVWEWMQHTCREVLYAGNSFTVKPKSWVDVDLTQLILPLSTIKQIRRSVDGKPLEIIQSIEGKTVKYAADDVIHFAWNQVDRKAFGVGLLTPLVSTRLDIYGDVVPPLLKVKAQIENDFRKLLHRYPPRFLIYFDVNDEKLKEDIRPVLETIKPGEDFLTNVKVDFKELSVSSRSQFDYILEYLTNQIYLSFGTPLPKLLTTPGFTEASARAAVEVSEAFREMMRGFLKTRYERLIAKPVLRELGFPDAHAHLHWGTPDISTPSFQDLCRAFELGGLRLEEFRRNLQRFGIEIWEVDK